LIQEVELFSAFTTLKEKALEAAARAFLNDKMGTFGTVRALSIDSRSKTIRVEVDLKGEPTPISVVVEAYELSQQGEDHFIAIQRASASREWITGAINQYLIGRRFKVPKAVRIGLSA
jgi:hypothetical protein